MEENKFSKKSTKIIGSRVVEIPADSYVDPDYEFNTYPNTGTSKTGHLVFAELKPNSLQLPIFLFRWDHGNNVVDVDIFQNDKPCNDLWDTKGYTGHRAEKIDEGKREYSFLIEIPGRKIFEGAIRVGLSFGLSVEPASFIMTGGSADVKVNRAENKDIKSKK